jgi:toxin ParE1/3/4
MTRISIEDDALADAERILSHLVAHSAADAGQRVADLLSALDVLERHPLIGRPAPPGLHELVIGRGARGYLALYRYEVLDDLVVVLALRAQREDGYRRR